jgi:hypothetical protein
VTLLASWTPRQLQFSSRKATAGSRYAAPLAGTNAAATISEGVVQLGIRQRTARVQILQDNLDAMRRIVAARAFKYSADMAGATGLMMKDYRGKNSEKEIWKFDAALVSQMNEVLKQAAIEEGQWTEKREFSVASDNPPTLSSESSTDTVRETSSKKRWRGGLPPFAASRILPTRVPGPTARLS